MSSQVPECLTLSRRLAAHQADAEARSSTATNKVGMPPCLAQPVAHAPTPDQTQPTSLIGNQQLSRACAPVCVTR